VKRFFELTIAGLFMLPTAAADISNETIRAYNEALQAGDRSAIVDASKALAAEAIANPTEQDAVLLAYEAGSQLCIYNTCESAQAAAEFVAASPIVDVSAHPVAEDRALLASFADWSADPKRKTRRDLDAALESIVSLQPTTLSIKAFEARYRADHTNGKARKAAKSADEAGDHVRPVAEQVPSPYIAAEFFAAISTFNSSQNASAQRDMTHLEGWLEQYETKLGEDAPDWINKQRFKAYAWRLAMTAWFQSTGNRGVSKDEIDTILASYQTDTAEPEGNDNSDHLTADILPFCQGQMSQTPKLRYRAGQTQRGFFGAVIVHFDIESGRVVNAHIEASVPEERFEEQALDAISQWTWEVEDGQIPGENCRMDRTNIVQPLVFSLD